MSSNLNIKTEKFGTTERHKFGKIEEIMEIPDLVEVQKNSYKNFITKGIRDVLRDFSPITDTDNLNRSDAREDNTDSRVELYFLDHTFDGKPKYTEAECKSRDATYAMTLKVRVRLVYKETGEVVDQEVYMGDIPIMTDNGSFIINGAERAIVSQLVKSPSVYCSEGINKAGKNVVETDIIPARGAWIEWEEDSNGVLWVHIDRSRKMVGTIFLRALGLSSNEELLEMFDNDPTIVKTIEKDPTTCREEALVEISKRLRPGEVVNYKAIQKDLEKRFYSTRRYDITGVGRHKFNQKLSLANRIEGKTLAEDIVINGEVYAVAGEVLDLERARYVQNAGVNKVAVEGKLSKFYVLGNNRVDITTYTGLDSEKAEIDEDVHLPTLLALLDGVTSTDEKQKIIEENRDELMGRHVLLDDILSSVNYHLCLKQGLGSYDDVDHLGNRRIKTVGELLQAQFFIGMARLERVISERMQTQNVEEISPSTLINVRPISAAIREFFGSSQMSQFMEQTNPIASLTHKRKVSSIGPGALTRERAGFDVRDVHYTHYGRLCPNETPEGQNIGLINSLATYAKIDKYGFVEAPYRRIDKETGKVTNEVVYMTADVEEKYVIAQANEELTPEGTLKNKRVTCRKKGEITELPREQIDFIDVSPKELVSIATTLVPFIENDDTTRAMMASNMQRQAVPLLKTEAPIVGTGTEHKIAVDSGVMVVSKHDGIVKYVSGDRVILATDEGDVGYELIPFVRSNNGTCMRQRPIVSHGQVIKKGDVLADGPSTKNGELSIGKNILVAFMPWEGYNFDDAILISDELVEEDVLTSIHIEEYEQDARDTKLGPEEITRDIPNVGEDALANLDENGIIRIGAEVSTGDILVGKVTPKGETELTPEERLLRAIFGEKAREVRDTSLRVQHGEGGVVVDVKVFTRENKDELSTGVNKLVRVYIAQKRKMSVGDKMSGRHGNKGVVSRVLPKADMPFMPDGTPVQILLNPLGVPSRMNIGQLLEVSLGFISRSLGWKIATPVFDGAKESDIQELFRANNFPDDGKVQLYDGRTGEPFENRTTVGIMYMLKLHHLVIDKMHARSTGPYSLVTQQPLGGKAQLGGQRFGEMEVWALEAYGASNILQEMLTVKSDDVVGRLKTYEAIVKGDNITELGIPESFKVLIKELQGLALDIKVLTEDKQEIGLKELMEDDRDIPEPLKNKVNRNEEEIEVNLGQEEELVPGELVMPGYDDNDDAGSLFDFDDDL